MGAKMKKKRKDYGVGRQGGVHTPYQWLLAGVIEQVIYDLRHWTSKQLNAEDRISAVQAMFKDDHTILGFKAADAFEAFPQIDLDTVRRQMYEETKEHELFNSLLKDFAPTWYNENVKNAKGGDQQ
jgi:hypothetical protein